MTPPILLRPDWHPARERSRPAMRLPVAKLYLHHTVTRATADPAADMRTVQRIGIQRFGFISYSWCIHSSGTILEGMGRNVGAHTAGHNSSALAVSLIGNYDTDPVPPAMVEATRFLVHWLTARGDLVAGTYPTGGHRDVKLTSSGAPATACPGRHAYALLGEFRRPWEPEAPAPPAPPPPPGPVHDYEEATVKTQLVFVGPLDPQGNGWYALDPKLTRDPVIVGATLLGPSPADDGYWDHQNDVTLAAQARDEKVIVSVRRGRPGDTVGAFVSWA